MNGSRVPIPTQVRRPFQVFVNGVPKHEGADYEVHRNELVFVEVLVQPRQMNMRSYARLMFWGRYKTEHSVDIAYDAGGRRVVASGLEILPPGEAGGESHTTE